MSGEVVEILIVEYFDFFWVLWGGGGNFGVVICFDF